MFTGSVKLNGVEFLAKFESANRSIVFIGQYSYGKNGNEPEIVVAHWDGSSAEWNSGHYFKAEDRAKAFRCFDLKVADECSDLLNKANLYYGKATA